MRQQSSKLLYLSCDKVNHKDHPLSQVCISAGCPEQELICDVCADISHKNHEVVRLSDFFGKLDNLKYSKHNTENQELKALKNLRCEVLQNIAISKKKIEESITRLDSIVVYYSNLEQQLADKDGEPLRKLEFVYNPRADIDRTNSQLKVVIGAYRQIIDRNINNNRLILSDTEKKTTKTLENLNKLVEDFKLQIQNIAQSYEKRSGLYWSETLRHADLHIDSVSKLTRYNNTTNNAEVMALIDCPLTENCWRLKIVSGGAGSWVGVGAVAEKQAQLYGFCTRDTKQTYIRKLPMLGWDGRACPYTLNIKRGKRFCFGPGDIITIKIDHKTRELRLQKESDVWCVIGLDQLQDTNDRYYPCVLLQKIGDCVEIIQ